MYISFYQNAQLVFATIYQNAQLVFATIYAFRFCKL